MYFFLLISFTQQIILRLIHIFVLRVHSFVWLALHYMDIAQFADPLPEFELFPLFCY